MALDRAKEYYETANDTEKKLLGMLFPELKENKNERVRNEIVSIVEQYGRTCEKEGDPCHDISACLDWLERQKEKDSSEWVYRALPGTYFDNAALKAIEYAQNGENIVFTFNGFYCKVEEHTTLDELRKEYDTFGKRQVAAVWTEEDENMFEKCISRMTDIIPVTGKSGGIKDMTFETRTEMECVKWLKKKLNR